MRNPTGMQIRSDPAGRGEFGARRGNRVHLGVDFLCVPGQEVVSSITGRASRIVYPYRSTRYQGIEIVNELFICHILYILPDKEILARDENFGALIKEGDVIGIAQDISGKYPNMDMEPHVHVNLYANMTFFM